jgi:plasmid stability protein
LWLIGNWRTPTIAALIAMIAVLCYRMIMAQLLVRNLDQLIVDDLKKAAARAGRSVEEEVRQSLALVTGRQRSKLLDEIAAFRNALGPLPGPCILDDLRADRDRDEFA